MAVNAQIYRDGYFVDVMLRPGEGRSAIADDIDVPGFSPNTYVWWHWDDEKFARGERDFLGLEIADVTAVSEDDLAALARADLPRIDVPNEGLADITFADAVRWAQQQYLASQRHSAPAKVS